MASFMYNEAVKDMFEETKGWNTTDDPRMLILGNGGAYTPAKGTTFIDTGGANDIVDDEIAVGGYARQALTTEAVDISTNLIRLLSDTPVAFGSLSAGATMTAAVIYWYNAADTLCVPIVYSDFADQATAGVTVSVNRPTNGWGHGDNT